MEKNWAPFVGENNEVCCCLFQIVQASQILTDYKKLYLHVSIIPQMIYKLVGETAMPPLLPNAPVVNCISQAVNGNFPASAHHHATPLLRVTLCERSKCVPDVHNTVLFGMIHVRVDYVSLPTLFTERGTFKS